MLSLLSAMNKINVTYQAYPFAVPVRFRTDPYLPKERKNMYDNTVNSPKADITQLCCSYLIYYLHCLPIRLEFLFGGLIFSKYQIRLKDPVHSHFSAYNTCKSLINHVCLGPFWDNITPRAQKKSCPVIWNK